MECFDDYQNNDNYDDGSNFFQFNDQGNIFFEQDYQNDGIYGSLTYMQPNDEQLILPPNIEEDNHQKCKTEQPKSLVKTAPTTCLKALLNKKREKEEEEEEEEEEEDNKEPKSDEVKASQKKVIKGEIFEISKEENKEMAKGRKKKFEKPGKHNKFSEDNIIRKIKTNMFDVLLRFINASIKGNEIEICEKKTKKIISIKPFLLKPDQEIIRNISIEFNLELLNSELKTIFKQDVSKKVKNHGLDKNKKLIEEMYREKKQKKTIDILNMTLYQCFEQINPDKKKYKELEGLEIEFKKVIENLEKIETQEYIDKFVYLVNTYSDYFNERKPRQTKKNAKLKQDDN